MPILPGGKFISTEDARFSVKSETSFANAILRQCKAKGIPDDKANTIAAPYFERAKMLQEALNQ